jgi:hypothetical protein
MKKIMHILFLSCLKATELIEKKLSFKLSFSEILQLKFHKMMCDSCKQYEKHSIILDKALSGTVNAEENSLDLSNLKKEILNRIEEKT